MDGLDALIARQPGGCSLLQEFYRDPAIFERDIARIHLRHWLCVGHASRIPDPGDYFVFDFADESLIIVRSAGDEIRALANVCRHRGSHVCYDKEGHSRVFVCPYHAWSYNLDGSLRSARYTSPDLDKSQYALKRMHVRVVAGLLLSRASRACVESTGPTRESSRGRPKGHSRQDAARPGRPNPKTGAKDRSKCRNASRQRASRRFARSPMVRRSSPRFAARSIRSTPRSSTS